MGNQQTSPTLTEKDIQILVKTSGKSENEIRQWYKEFHEDSNHTDRLTKRQFKKYYSKLKNNPNLEQLTDHIFRAFDTDHSGTIDFSEFLLTYIATTTGTDRQIFEYAFEVYDIDDNQVIDKKEAQKIYNLICRIAGLSEEDAQSYTNTLMVSFDANQDKVLTKSEFVEGCLHDTSLGKISNPFRI